MGSQSYNRLTAFNSYIESTLTMAELGLKKKEIDAINFAFDVYDFKGDGKVDAFYAGDLIRACNLNPTLKTIAEVGGTEAKGQKMLTKADVFPMYKACKDSKDQGGFHDFVEILKLYDKNDVNTMLAHELFRLLTNLGELLTMKDSCLSSPSLRECVLLRSKCSPPSTKYKNIYKKNCHHEVRGTSSDLNSPVLSDDFLLLLTHILGCQEQGVSQSEHSRKYCNKY